MANEFLSLLHHQHDHVKNILEELEKTSEKTVEMREDLFITLKNNLTPHLLGEEKYFYPVLAEHSEARQDTLEAEEEHHAARLILDELDKTPKHDERWGAKLSVLREMIDYHVKEEESKVFNDARTYLNEARMQDIMRDFQSEEKVMKEQMGRVDYR